MAVIKEVAFDSTAVQTVTSRDFRTPYTVAVVPGAGATITVEYSMDDAKSYTAWVPGSVTSATNAQVIDGMAPTHWKFTASVAATTCYAVFTQ